MNPPWDLAHPVLELLRRRRADGSQVGTRSDSAKLGLAVEGGGMRGIISCAMLNALEDLGYGRVFDAVYGGSSGSVNAAYFLARRVWHSLSIYYDDLASSRFIDLRRMLRGGPIFDVDYAFDVVFELTKPLDYTAVLASPTPLHVSITLVDEMRTIAPADFTTKQDLKDALRAGAWLPLATKGVATFRGQRAIDGGALTVHPSRLAIEAGCTHVLSLSTRPSTYRQGRPDLLQLYAARHLNRLRPGLGTRFLEADLTGAQDRRTLARWRQHPAEPAVLDICLPDDPGLTRHDINSGRLLAAARAAYEVTSWALTGVFERAYPRLTTKGREQAHSLSPQSPPHAEGCGAAGSDLPS
jgi:predicted patatin/cPLA2 family phospholipase